jgi:lipase
MIFYREWEGDGPVVLALHGITASHLSWASVASALNGAARFVAVDLRGRGQSAGLGGPYGMRQHALDLVDVLDSLEVEQAVVVGQSMGAYVANVLAEEFPSRVSRLVLVDGGLPLPMPEGMSVDQVLEAVIGPAVARLSMTFPSREAYHEFWRAHPALAGAWSPSVEEYVDYDLVPADAGDGFRSRVDADAVRGDSEDTLASESVRTAVTRLPCPAVLLRAERGMLDDPVGLFPDPLVSEWLPRAPMLTDLGVVPDTNHYTILFAPHAAAAVAKAVIG